MSRVLAFWASVGLAVAASAQSRLDVLRGDDESRQFAQALQPRAFEFPQDHGPHPDFRHEWWYFTGHLQGENGERFGFELTFFRYALVPATDGASDASAWRTHQVYMAHFAVTDIGRKEFHFSERHSREALGLAGAQAQPLRVWLEDWSLQQSQGGWAVRAAADRYSLDLQLKPAGTPVLNGEAGLSRKSANVGAASYYYSMPRIQVRGQLERDGAAIAVQGTAWLDREWGSGALASDQRGWDWFALQLDDGSSLMFYALRRRDGRRDSFSAGTWVDADGRSRAIVNSDVQIEVLGRWSSPNGGDYPALWRLQVHSLNLDLHVRPLLANQELLSAPRYWEGAVSVEGRRENVKSSGEGYVELVGYAQDRKVQPTD